MNLPFFIAKRIAFNRSSSFSKFIINIAIAATGISVAVMILAVALVNGFQEAVQQKIFSFWGHMHITQFQANAGPLTEQFPFAGDSSMVTALKQIKGINTVNAYATKSAIIKAEKDLEGVIFKGVDRHYNWGHLQQFLQEGSVIHYNDSSYAPEVLISVRLARELQLKLHDPLIIYFIQGPGQAPRARKLTVSGIFKTGIEEYDKTYVLGDLELIRKLNNWEPGSVGGYEIFMDDYRRFEDVSSAANNVIPAQLFIRSITDIYPNIFAWLRLQSKNKTIVLVIMSIVAAINMVTAILILILERTNMIGILKALGLRNRRIQAIFVTQAAYIVMAGIVLGNILGIGLAILQQTTGLFKLPEESYYMSVAAVSLVWWHIALIDVGTLVLSIAVLMLPSLIIRRITPVKAIQFK
ncbi:FtsX-like permease family protein [Chitinophaga filiformis]|uniref:ABC transporter permease n=1 Tax=Chitinophaga filiformis TaxID=104663 RepID=UPI001F1DDC1E|nr:FtsX-like permease family protein [Chitinophaga filiformis]MCF6405733.1 FtsX-like permease family protein [Chitinophaga filiformis]